jgi:hypothetical protein
MERRPNRPIPEEELKPNAPHEAGTSGPLGKPPPLGPEMQPQGERRKSSEPDLPGQTQEGALAQGNSESTLLQQKNSDKRKEYRRRYYQKNKERLKEKSRQYYQENKDKRKASKRQYYQENKDKLAKHMKRYSERNKNKLAEYKKRYALENKEKIAEQQSQYYQKRKEQRAADLTQRAENQHEDIQIFPPRKKL